jgi:putative Mg2+ transporter-C (MgtC) family protein
LWEAGAAVGAAVDPASRWIAALWVEAQSEQRNVPLGAASVRLFAALVFGGVIGWERERRDRPAGLRTHILVAMASALFAILALEIASGVDVDNDALRVDPTRVVEAVTAGVAFLAAGAIIQSGGKVKGLTTGAGMWMAGALGVACGLGHIVLSLILTIAAVVVLSLLRQIE